MLDYEVKDRVRKAPLENVKVKGYPGELMDTFFSQRIFSDHARNMVYKEAEDAFVNCVDDDSEIYGVGIWQGEFWGKWIISACRVYRYTGESSLKEFIHKGALKLISLQREDGYLGTYKTSHNFISAPPEKTSNNWNWNIWCRKYTLWAMLECYGITDDKRVLDCCTGMANQLISELKQTNTDIGDTGTFKGMPSCSIMKPMLILYRLTEDKKYLDFCLSIADRWENSRIMPVLIANALSKKPLTQWYEGPSNKWAKAYEMMSCFDGICELYRVTGNKKYLDACESFYDILMEHEKNLLFSVAYNDVFGDAAYGINSLTEPCDVIHLMRLCHELFCITGKAKYMDTFEMAFYNPFMASAFKDGKWGARAARASGRHLVAKLQARFVYNHCCVNNMPRGFMNMAESCIMTDGEAVVINFYSPCEVCIDGVKVICDGDYIADGKAEITVDFRDSDIRKIRMRIPSYSTVNKITAEGVTYTPERGFFTLDAKSDKVKILAEFDDSTEVRLISPVPEKAFDWKASRFDEWDSDGNVDSVLYLSAPRYIIRKGVSLLCRTKLIGNTEEEMFSSPITADNLTCTAERIEKPNVNTAYTLTFSDGSRADACDYASGTNIMSDDKRLFSIYF